MSEQDHACETKTYVTNNIQCVYLVAHETFLSIEWGLFTKSKNLCFILKCTILCPIGKIFTGYVEWAFRHPHVKYLTILMILKFLHKLVYNYRYTGLQVYYFTIALFNTIVFQQYFTI